MAYKITLVRGDGTGPELTEVTAKVIEATGVKIDWEVMEAGVDIMEKEGTPLPDKTLQSIAKNKIALKGPITTPIGTGFRSVNVAIRKELDLFTCLRPCKSYVGVKSRFSDIDLVVVRENTEDLYAGVEFPERTDEANKIIELSKGKIRPESSISIKSFSEFGCERIVRFAFDYAVKNSRKKVTAVAKANIMKCTDGMFYRVAREVAKDYEGKMLIWRFPQANTTKRAGNSFPPFAASSVRSPSLPSFCPCCPSRCRGCWATRSITSLAAAWPRPSPPGAW